MLKKGQSLVEILVVIGLLSILLPALITGIVSSRGGEAQQKQRIDATALLKEGADAVRNIKYNDWNSFAQYANGNNSYLQYNSTSHQWELFQSPVPTPLNGFTRTIVITGVNRDSSGNIAVSGGTNDPSTKKVTITVSWSTPYNSFINSTFYLSRLDNLADFDTTICPTGTCPTTAPPQFGAGAPTGVAVIGSVPSATPTPYDGQVEIGHGGTGNWCDPTLNDTSNYKLLLNGNSDTNAIWAAYDGGNGFNYAYIVTGGSASTNFPFIKITQTNPPNPSVVSTFNQYKAAGIYGDASGTYAYLALTSPASKQVSIIRLSTNQEVSSINTGEQDPAHTIFVSGNTLYFTSGKNGQDYLYTYDISTITNPTRLGSSGNRTLLDGYGKKIYVVNNKAYIATDSTTKQLNIVDVNNPASLPASPTDSKNVGNGQPGTDLYVNQPLGTEAILSTNVTSSSQTDSAHSDFFIINLADNNKKYGHYNTYPMNPKGVTKVAGNLAIVVGKRVTSGNPYQVLNLLGESNSDPLLTMCGGLPTATFDINNLFSVSELNTGSAYSYIVTNENGTPTFRIVPGGPGGSIGNTGTFTSRTFIPSGANSTAFNKFIVNYSQPSNTSLTFLVGVANLISGSCSNNPIDYTFVGPNLNGTPFPTPTGALGTTTTVNYAIPFGTASPSYTNPGFCFKYQASFNNGGDNTRTPVLYDVTLNYSP